MGWKMIRPYNLSFLYTENEKLKQSILKLLKILVVSRLRDAEYSNSYCTIKHREEEIKAIEGLIKEII